ncbi:MAG: SIMPL domain-containing protein [Gemmatimonadaceae bacterium]|nr:SIMPL domain-containing protein [Gemmatimonadaceae bacterium]
MSDGSSRSSSAGLIAVAVGIVAAAFLVAGAVRDVGRKNDVIEVTGSARRPIVADLGIWNGTVTVQSPTVAGSYAEVTGYGDRVRAWLRSRGLADSVITVRPVETNRMMVVNSEGQQTGQVAGYKVSQTVEVRLFDPRAIEKLAREAGELAGQGIPFEAASPQYLYTKLAELRIQMMGEATRDARARADVISKAAGAEVGNVRSANTGVVQITPRFSTEVSDYGMNDVTSIEKDITTVVKVTFALK